MKVNGSHVLRASPQQVWDALQDPAVLVRTIPGCQEMEETGDDTYAARVHAGIASIKGIYDGQVSLADQDPPNSYTLRAKGSGAPGTIDATASVSLREDGAGTRVEYDADAVLGGAIAGVGQRVVAGVAKRNAKTFFDAVDRYLAGELDEAAAGVVAGPERQAGAVEEARTDGGTVYRRPVPAGGPSTGMPDALALILAAVAGAAIALLGVLVGQRRRG